MAATSRRRLGKGLSEMFAEPVAVSPASPPAAAHDAGIDAGVGAAEGPSVSTSPKQDAETPPPRRDAAGEGGVRFVAIHEVTPNRFQPRRDAVAADIETLADSIRTHGVMQPIVLRPRPAEAGGNGDAAGRSESYELIAGERRWRAARSAGLDRVPAVVRDLSDRDAAEWALVENLQREDLNPMDRAQAFVGLVERFGLTHDEIAQRVGVDRSTVANLIRLLDLAEPVQALVRDGRLAMGHARAIAGLSDAEAQAMVAERAVRQSLSVRQVEKLAKSLAAMAGSSEATHSAKPNPRVAPAPHLGDLERRIGEQLGTQVAIRPGRKKGTGRLTIEFHSLDAFDDLLSRLGVETE